MPLNKFILTFGLLTFCYGSIALAEPLRCEQVLTTRDSVTVVGFSPRDERRVLSIVRRVLKIAGHLSIPATVIKKTEDSYRKSAYSTGRDLLKFHLPSYPEFRKYALVILAHEIGHAIFDNYLKFDLLGAMRTVPEAIKLIEEMENQIRLEPEYLAIQEKINQIPNANGFYKTVEADNLNVQLNRQLRNYFQLRQNVKTRPHWEKIRRISDFILVHNELFADMVAVLTFRDGQAVSNIFTRQTPYGTEENHTRDFTQLVTLDFFRIQEKGIFDTSGELIEYEGLNPSRSHLWRNYLASRLNQVSHGKVLEAFLRATIRHYEMYPSPHERPYPDEYVRFNQEFIKLLDEELKTP